MKYSFFFVLLCVFSASLFSCKKSPSEITPTPPEDTTITYDTKLGAFITNLKGDLSNEFQDSVLTRLNTGYIRETIVMENWMGRNRDYDYFTERGYKILLNIHSAATSKSDPVFFVTDTIPYKILLDEILSKYSPELVFIENEPGNFQKHKGSMQSYLNQLTAAMSVVHKYGLKGADGGFSTRPLTFLVYRYYLRNGENDKAADFAKRCIPQKYMVNLSNPGRDEKLEGQIAKWDSLVQGYRTVPIDYVCVHLYEPILYRGEDDATALSSNITSATPGVFKEISDYIFAETGKQIVSNEIGQLNLQPQLVSSVLKVCNQIKMPYTIWFSGDWGIDNSYALNNEDGTLRENGIAFRDFIDLHK